MTVRPYVPEDAPQIADVFRRSVLGLGRRFYSDQQVIAWAARGPTPEQVLTRNKDGRLTLVSIDDPGGITAYAELEPDGHIDQVYALPEVAGSGVTARLYNELEKTARRMGIKKLYTEASEGALRFFLKKGFTKGSRRDFEIDGVAIHNYQMDKAL